MPLDTTKLHYQMLRKTLSGTSDEALAALQEKIQEVNVAPGEPIVVFFEDAENNKKGAYMAVPASGIESNEEADAFIFPNKKEIEARMEEDETVTTAALLDLDERISAVTQTVNNLNLGDLGDMIITESVTANGTSAGAIEDGQTVPCGTTLTELVKMMLTKELDWTGNAPKLNISITPTTKQEVGSNVTIGLSNTPTDGYFSSDFANNVNAGQTGGTVTYHITSGSTTNTTTGSSYVLSAVTEGDYSVRGSLPYNAVTATSKGLTKNTGAATSASIAAGTVSSTTKTVEVRYKAWMGCTSATTAAQFSLNSATNLVKANGDFLPTSGNLTLVGATPWESDGTNVFILTTGSLSQIKDSLSKGELKTNFNKDNSNQAYNFTYTNNGVSTTYHLYIWAIGGGTKVQVINTIVTR